MTTRLRRVLACVALVGTVSTGGVHAAAQPANKAVTPSTQPTQPGPNAVPLYREAFALLDTLDKDDRRRLGLCGPEGCWVVTTPLDEAAAKLLEGQMRTVELTRRAAAMPATRWELNGDGQKKVDLANHAPRLSALMVLQARTAFRDGQTHQGLDDLFVAITLSRHATTEATVLTKLVEMSACRPAAELLTQQLPALPKESVAALKARFDRLPPSPTMREVILGEYAYARQAGRNQGFVTTAMVVTMKDFYDALAEAAPLSPQAFVERVDEEMAKHPINPWVKVLAPTLKRSRVTVAAFEAKSAMLDAAVEVVLHGEGAVKASVDPFGDGPFKYEKRPGGFTLESALMLDDQPVKLVVGF